MEHHTFQRDMGKSTIDKPFLVAFGSYVSLPEGNIHGLFELLEVIESRKRFALLWNAYWCWAKIISSCAINRPCSILEDYPAVRAIYQL